MKKEQIEEYIRLDEMFSNECCRVCNILAGQLDNEHGRGINSADGFVVCGNNDRVKWDGGDDGFGGYFPLAYLTLSDDELKKIVELKNQLYQYTLKAETRAEEEKQRLSRKKLYEELKKEFGI